MKRSELEAAAKRSAELRAAKGLPPNYTPAELKQFAKWGAALMAIVVLVVGGIVALNWNTIQARSAVQQKCEHAWNTSDYYHGSDTGKYQWVNNCIANTGQ